MNESMNESINDGGDCRIAPAIPGLLKINFVMVYPLVLNIFQCV